jgi:peptidoglycan hydrolase-like protein with peptidoglycan-binding domain
MTTISDLVRRHGSYSIGARGSDVIAIQTALTKAGYSTNGIDGVFGSETRDAVYLYEIARKNDIITGVLDLQCAMDLDADAKVGPAPPVAGEPLIHEPTGMPHDDTASLIAFYGDPRGGASVNPRWMAENVVMVKVPYTLYFDKTPENAVPFHKRIAENLQAALEDIWDMYDKDSAAIRQARLDLYSGTGNYRPIRGSSRLSCHAFWAAIDLNAENLPLGRPNPRIGGMPANAVEAFKKHGFYWGGDFHGRPDPMHFQGAHE